MRENGEYFNFEGTKEDIIGRVIQPKKIPSQSPKIRLSFRYSFMEAE